VLDRLERTEEAIAELRYSLYLDPKEPRTYLTLARALRARGRYDDAIAALTEASRIAPRNGEVQAQLRYALAEPAMVHRTLAERRAAVALSPESAGAHAQLADALAWDGNAVEALAESAKAAELAPGDSGYHRTYALREWWLGERSQALDEFTLADSLVRNDSSARGLQAWALAGAGRRAEAIAIYRDIVSRNPGEGRFLNYFQSDLGSADGGPEAMAADLKTALASEPNSAELHLLLAAAYETDFRADEATEEYRRTSALDARFAYAHGRIGLILRDEGRSAEASEEFHLEGEAVTGRIQGTGARPPGAN
jgi:tetratricopeptide (TPR) repeat protein